MSGGADDSFLLNNQQWSALKSCVARFEEAWRHGLKPDIEKFLSGDGNLRRCLVVELAHIELELRLKKGEPARVEQYLSRFPELNEAPAMLDLVVAEYELRRRVEPELQLDEYARRFPRYADALPSIIAAATIAEGHAAQRTPPAAPIRHSVPIPNVAGYELLDLLGRGGMGVVYRARQLSLDRPVALKFLPADCSQDPVWLDRFHREAHTASGLNHPNICTIYDSGDAAGQPYLSMELIDGHTLDAWIGKRPPIEDLAQTIGQAALALVAAHEAGVVHRDIKPQNIMVRTDGIVKVLDFGLARRLPAPHGPSHDGRDTDKGTRIGTILYMSPEQTRAEPVDTATDIFSLGVVLYQLATGRHPFAAESEYGTMHAIATREVGPAARLDPEIPAGLDALIRGMLAKDSRLRPTAADVHELLENGFRRASKKALKPSPAAKPFTVGRRQEISELQAAFDHAADGRGMFVCVSGEPGLGKTTLVEEFLAGLDDANDNCLIACGRCSERLAGTEAYLPLIDSLADLLRREPTGSAARLMKVLSPTWYAQVAPSAQLSPPAETSAPPRASSQQAMLREFVNLLQELSQQHPVALFFDDIQWADISTVDLLAYLGRHLSAMRVLVVITYRPTELLLGPHPFHLVKLDLQGKGICTDLALNLLSREEIESYLRLTFPRNTFPADFADLLCTRTEGHPLFLVDLLRDLREHGVLSNSSGTWLLGRQLPDLRRELPESVRSMVQRELERLRPDDRRLLAVASVQGAEFDSAVVADVMQIDAAVVEERLQTLDRTYGLVRLVRESEFPDRTLTMRYAFAHGLYQQALFADLSPSRRAGLGAELARCLENHHGERSATVASELACLYEVGRDFVQAARQFGLAAQNAARLYAHREAVGLARRGLRLLENLSAPERDAEELPLQTTLGLQLQLTEGYAAPAAQRAYARARELCANTASSPGLFSIVWGQWLFEKVRSDLGQALAFAEELRSLAQAQAKASLLLQAQQALTVTALCRGEPATALRHMEHAATLYDQERHRGHSSQFGQDPGVACKAFGSVALWLLGFPDEAIRQSDASLRLSHELSQPSSQALALHFAAMLHQLRRDEPRAQACAETCRAIAEEHGFAFWQAGASVICGWALAARGDGEAGEHFLRQGLKNWLATGSVTYHPYYLGLLAEVLHRQGKIEEAAGTIDEALEIAERIGERFYVAELHRLRGELTFQLHGESSTAERDYRLALDIANRQAARSLTLRVAMSLARLLHGKPAGAEARAQLCETYHGFTEGWETADLQLAKALLEEIG